MAQKTGKLKIFFNKIAAKRFSNKEKAVLLIVFLVLSGGLLFYVNSWIIALKQEAKIIEPIVPKQKISLSANISEQIKQTVKEIAPSPKKPDIRDPFLASLDSNILRAPTENLEPVVNLNLQGILWDKRVASAIINSKVVKIGDLIYGKTVVDIEQDKVILMENGKIHILKLLKR